ncbi:recombination protein NinG [Paraburkholderia caffeinilytica]|uniref:recombination protein NinG n=1 Tax=Paraburkholderia caffeinilytica TaxID=1761016 RepID=UPI0038B9AD81
MNRSSFQPKMLKPKKCRMCSSVFVPQRSMAVVCSPACAQAWARKLSEQKAARAKRDERKSFREAVEKSKTRGTHLKELQAVFNAWVRQRDAGQPCIACQRHHQGQNHAGHYRSVGSCPELRFEPDNVHLTCQPCNVHLSGNLIQMRIGMIKKIGLARVEWIEGPHEPKKYTIAEIVALKAEYRAKVREMKKVATVELEVV